MGGGVLGLARGAPRSFARALGALALTGAALTVASPARAVSALFAGAGDAKLEGGAVEVVLMRDGDRTVVTMKSEYAGPPEDFLMIVPVPSSVSPDDVRTVPAAIFDRLDALTAPRLVEYWEEDPCPTRSAWDESADAEAPPPAWAPPAEGSEGSPGAIRTEAQFSTGEYDVLVLPASDHAALDRVLRANKMELPPGGQAALRPYAEAGAKLLVLRVDIERVKYDNGRASLSPIRFQYDEPVLTVPLRLGAVSGGPQQDVLVYVLSPHQRYEASSYPDAIPPTNVEVAPSVKASFGPFFVALEAATVTAAPNAVLTEYAWSAATCDPCTVPPLSDAELTLLGGDVIPSTLGLPDPEGAAPPPPPPAPAPLPAAVSLVARDAGAPAFVAPHDPLVAVPSGLPRDFVLTRLRARLAKVDIVDDLELRKAPPIEGGREFSGGHAPVTLTADAPSSFQARYVVRNAWSGAVDCDDPRWGVFGGESKESAPSVEIARDLSSSPADAGAPLASLVSGDLPAIGLQGTLAPPSHTWRRSTASRLKDPWAAFAIGLFLGTLGLGIVVTRAGRT